MDEQNKSVGWVALALSLTVAYFCWAFLAADYHGVALGGNRGRISGGGTIVRLVINSIVQLPNFSEVIRHGFQNRSWIFIVFGIAEVVVLLLWIMMRKMERELWDKKPSPDRSRRRR
jgi:hypothetical protein